MRLANLLINSGILSQRQAWARTAVTIQTTRGFFLLTALTVVFALAHAQTSSLQLIAKPQLIKQAESLFDRAGFDKSHPYTTAEWTAAINSELKREPCNFAPLMCQMRDDIRKGFHQQVRTLLSQASALAKAQPENDVALYEEYLIMLSVVTANFDITQTNSSSVDKMLTLYNVRGTLSHRDRGFLVEVVKQYESKEYPIRVETYMSAVRLLREARFE